MQASKDAAKGMVEGRAAVRGAFSSAVSRVGNTGLNFLVEAANPEVFSALAIAKLHRLIERLHSKGVLAPEQAAEAQNLLSQGKYPELDQYLQAAQAAYIRGDQ